VGLENLQGYWSAAAVTIASHERTVRGRRQGRSFPRRDHKEGSGVEPKPQQTARSSSHDAWRKTGEGGHHPDGTPGLVDNGPLDIAPGQNRVLTQPRCTPKGEARVGGENFVQHREGQNLRLGRKVSKGIAEREGKEAGVHTLWTSQEGGGQDGDQRRLERPETSSKGSPPRHLGKKIRPILGRVQLIKKTRLKKAESHQAVA